MKLNVIAAFADNPSSSKMPAVEQRASSEKSKYSLAYRERPRQLAEASAFEKRKDSAYCSSTSSTVSSQDVEVVGRGLSAAGKSDVSGSQGGDERHFSDGGNNEENVIETDSRVRSGNWIVLALESKGFAFLALLDTKAFL